MSTFSVTERASFKRCRRSWWWGSFNGAAITPAIPSTALSVGTIWHRGGELWAIDKAGRHFHELMMQAYDEVKAEIVAQLATVGGELCVDDEYSLEEQRTLLEAMATNYEGYWHSPLPDNFVMIQPEQTVLIDVPGSPHKLEATLDGLIKNTNNGLAYVLERKTYGARPNEESLQFGDQYLAYLWVLQQLGFETGGVAYDGAWKRPSPPRGKDINDLFLRFIITRNQHEIDEFGTFLIEELAEMEEAKRDPSKRTFNRRWEGCWECSAFKELCYATSRGETEMVTQIMSKFVKRQPKERAAIWPIMPPE